jgi:predicted nuclease of predicted toxin-antitoxin system
MRFLLDENVSYRVCPPPKAAGHDAVHVGEIGLASTDDQVILDRARSQDRVLISSDHDFVQLLFSSGDIRPSLILVRELMRCRRLPSPNCCSPLFPASSPNCSSLVLSPL